ncbi:unnamed protein product [Paramecium pentaurelia]|uniref:PH domain containing protein n=1 Tax=Paramecium pentaurelia TaxID=43138 RepID=A0A8S1V6A4_9CILI|nr:unnamed protein product [Paramecium pentaurelia]
MLNSQTQSQSAMSILGYVPALIVQHLLNLKMNKLPRNLPEKQNIKSVVMFADISGFTKLTEKLSQLGTEGAERIAFAINRYMELLVQGIGRSGGDIFKFAGDAMIVIWPPPPEGNNFVQQIETLLKQAIQSALLIQEKLTKTTIEQGIQLSVKIGFGVGEMSIIHVGGVFNRIEYLATGDPLLQAFASEHCLTEGGKIIISQQVYNLVNNFFECKEVEHHENHYEVIQIKSTQAKVKMKADALLIKNNITIAKFQAIRNEIQSYIPAALLPYIEINEEPWSAELRRLSVMFVNLGIDLNDAKSEKGLQQIQRVIMTVQKCIYMHEGSLNKLLMDDKGSTLIIVFGLPPLSHQNDAVRSILTAQLMRIELPKINCGCAIGIVTGTVFAGVVGTSGSRREYSVLGDSVNLAARLMQAACEEKEYKILVCSETAKSAEHNLSFQFLRSQIVKGKNQPVEIYVPLEKSQASTPGNFFPILRTNNYAFGFKRKTEFANQQIFGREEPYKKILNQVDKIMRGIDKKGLFIIKGSFGVGKTMLIKKVLHRVQEKLNSNQYNPWKYGEMPQILTSQLNPVTRSYKLNGLRQILKQIFILYSKRLEREPDLSLFQLMIDESLYSQNTINLLKEILDLKCISRVDNFPPKSNDDENQQELKKITLQFFSNYFEQVPEKYQNLYIGRSPEELGWDIKQSNIRQVIKYSIKYSNIICPVILCLDDMQNYDNLTFKIISLMIKTYDRIQVLGLYRDNFHEMTLQVKTAEKKKSQEEIAMDGISRLEDAIEQNFYSIIQLKGIERKGKDDEFAKMIRYSFNISKFDIENVKATQEEIRKRDPSIINDVCVQETLNKEMNHQFLFFQNKQQLIEQDIELLLLSYIYLKTSGVPLMVLNFTQNLIDQGYIKIGNKSATITKELINLINYEESIIIDAPCDRVAVNGPIIDKLPCLEQLILKVASIIGDIFDIQMLSRINPFKVAVNNRLQKMMDELEQKDFIETMEVQEQNIYYRFTCPFMRDCLYQRITFKQRRQLHKAAAEAIQLLPLAFEIDERIESKKLQFHWVMAEQNNQLVQQSTQNFKARQSSGSVRNLVLRATFGIGQSKQKQEDNSNIQLAQNNQYKFENLSSKAMRSIILKQISNKLTKNNNNINTILKEGILEKKSKQNVSWAPRYWVLDGKEMRCYYTKQDMLKKELPLCTIPLKGIYSVIPLDVREQGETNFPLSISSTLWYKKNKEMGERRFLLNSKNVEDLEMWIIYLEFAKAKAIYDDFTNNYGKISFPLGNNNDYYDPEFKYDVNIEKQKLSLGLQYDKSQQAKMSKNSVLSRNSRASRMTIATKQFKFMEKASQEDNLLQTSQIIDSQLLKDRINCFLQKSMLLLFSHLFDMSLQKQDDYNLLGQPNMVMKKMTNIFKIDKQLTSENKKQSNAFINNQSQSQSISITNSSDMNPNVMQQPQQQQQQRKAITLDGNPLIAKKMDTSLDEESGSSSNEGGEGLLQTKTLQQIMEEEYDNEMSESTNQQQQQLKQQRNQKYIEEIRMKQSSKFQQEDRKRSDSQESFEQNIAISRRHTDRQDQVAKQMNYFKLPNQQQEVRNITEFKLDMAIQVDLQKLNNSISKSISKSSIDPKSELSYQQNDNQEFLKLFENSTNQGQSQQNNQFSNKILDDNKRDTIQTHISSSNFLSTQYPFLHHQSTLLSSNTNQKLRQPQQYASRQSQISQKTIANSISSQQNQYGTALNTCKSLSGDIFTLRPGYRVVVTRIDQQKKLIYCNYQNMQGLFYLRDIAVIEENQDDSQIKMKSRTPTMFELKYKELLNDRFNTRSKSPNYRSAQCKTPPKKPFMRF